MSEREKVEVCLEIKIDDPRHKAILFTDGTNKFWLPRAVVKLEPDCAGEGDDVNVIMPEWLAHDRGLI